MVMTRSEAFRILEIDSGGGTADKVRASYKRLALKWHPDKHNNSAEATTKFQEISEAYKRLTSNTDDDNIKITMGDMFDLFAHIFFTNGRYYATTHDLHYSDDDNGYTRSSDSSEEEVLAYRPRQARSKYCDLFATRTTVPVSATKNIHKKNDYTPGISEAEAMKNAEELIKEEERNKKKAEKKRAKKKRNRAKRKQRGKDNKPDDDPANDNSEEEEDKEDEEAKAREEQKQYKKSTKEQNSKNNTTTNSKSRVQNPEEDSASEHEEASWDTSSAFFANAARRGPVNNPNETNPSVMGECSNVSNPTSVQNNENNSQTTRLDKQKDDEELDPVVIQSRQMAVRGNNLANEGKYKEAIGYFSKAISLHNCDFRFFGNRSYCFDRLGDYSKALEDAEVTIALAPVWPKGYFRKGRALAGLKQYADAETAFSQVLKLDKHCDDAKFELTRVRVQQLKDMGFAHAQSERAVRLFGTVHAALDALLSGKVKNLGANEEETYVSGDELDDDDEQEPRTRNEDQCSLWIGNVDPKEVTERQLTQLFSKYGAIKLIRILPPSFCAFVNYETNESAAKALQYLQGYSLGGQNIRIRYPNNDKYQKSLEIGTKPSGPVNGDECYFWRTTGCAFGDKCRHAHVQFHRGIDLEKYEQKFGKTKLMAKKGK